MSPQRDQDTRLVTRGLVRSLAAGVVLAGALTPVTAFADEPVGWESVKSVSGLQFFLVLLVAPATLAVVITLLVAVPSWLRGHRYEAGQAWAGDDEWFGGPQDSVSATSDPARIEAAGEQGGAGARY